MGGVRFSLLITAFLALAGCTTATLEELRHTVPNGTPFQKALAEQYLVFADSEAKAYDWVSMKVFSEKGLTAAYGNDPEPELVANWSIPSSLAPEFEAARGDLLAVLTPTNKEVRPALAARAQYSFDCWLEQQEEGWQMDDINSCRSNFYAAVNELKGTRSDSPEDLTSSSYLVLFEFGKATLNAKGIKVVESVVKDLKGTSDYEIVLNGYTDRAGSDNFNLSLSQRRSEAVRIALVKRGIAERAITEYAYGESSPQVPTEDGVREKANRRVEIFINE